MNADQPRSRFVISKCGTFQHKSYIGTLDPSTKRQKVIKKHSDYDTFSLTKDWNTRALVITCVRERDNLKSCQLLPSEFLDIFWKIVKETIPPFNNVSIYRTPKEIKGVVRTRARCGKDKDRVGLRLAQDVDRMEIGRGQYGGSTRAEKLRTTSSSVREIGTLSSNAQMIWFRFDLR